MGELGRTEQTITAVLDKTELEEAHASLEDAMSGFESVVRQKLEEANQACRCLEEEQCTTELTRRLTRLGRGRRREQNTSRPMPVDAEGPN